MTPACYSVKTENLAISPDTPLTTLFAHFAQQPFSILLDSANSQHPDANVDIFVAAPVATLTTTEQVSRIEYNGQIRHSKDDPIELLAQLQTQVFGQIQAHAHAHTPFTVGAMGYWGYDLGRRFETLPSQAHNPYHTPDMAVGLYSWSVSKNRHSGQFYFSYIEQLPYPDKAQLEQLANTSLPPHSFALTGDWQANMSKAEYQKKLARISDYLHAGDCYQVNLAQRFQAAYTGDEWQAYLALRQANQAPFSAFIRLPQSCILSISPERFLSVKDNQVQSKPIKGTRPRYTQQQQDQHAQAELKNSPKDRAENLMIVDLLRNDLSRNCQPGSVDVPELFAIESFPAVHHLVSTVTGVLKPDSSPLQLLRDAFPGGSITGAPKIRAMQIIDELEPHRRNIYCGSIGYLDHRGNLDTSICIRTLLCEQGQIYCWAGGGIVLDSDAASEYQETLDKVGKILPVLQKES